jgi:CheY-like chemotaxis protein
MGRRDYLPTDALVGIHVLIVDDDEDARELIATVLRYCGALVTDVASASEGLRLLTRIRPDVAVCDIAMPERDGYWFVREAHSRPHDGERPLPVIAITAHGEMHGPVRTLPAGFQAHVRKPIDPWELCRLVHSLAGRRTP